MSNKKISGGWKDEREKTYDFTKKLLTLVFPIAFQQFMLALVSASDALMLGMLTQDSLSAVSLASQVTFVENLFLMAMTIGLSMFAAQYWGKGDKGAVERIFAYVMKVTAAVSFLFFLAGMCVPGFLMRIFTDELPLIEGGRVYLRTVSLAFLLTGISQVYLCIEEHGQSGKIQRDQFCKCGGQYHIERNPYLWLVWIATNGNCGRGTGHGDCQSDRGGLVYF